MQDDFLFEREHAKARRDAVNEQIIEAAMAYATACGAISGLEGPWLESFKETVGHILARAMPK